MQTKLRTKIQFKNNTMTMKFGLISIFALLYGCESYQPNIMAQQQNYICKSLIDGFLKTQQLAEYQLAEISPRLDQVSAQRHYRYSISSDVNFRIEMPKKNHLKFVCNQLSAQRFNIELVDAAQQTSTALISIALPSKQEIAKLTAYVFKPNDKKPAE